MTTGPGTQNLNHIQRVHKVRKYWKVIRRTITAR